MEGAPALLLVNKPHTGNSLHWLLNRTLVCPLHGFSRDAPTFRRALYCRHCLQHMHCIHIAVTVLRVLSCRQWVARWLACTLQLWQLRTCTFTFGYTLLYIGKTPIKNKYVHQKLSYQAPRKCQVRTVLRRAVG